MDNQNTKVEDGEFCGEFSTRCHSVAVGGWANHYFTDLVSFISIVECNKQKITTTLNCALLLSYMNDSQQSTIKISSEKQKEEAVR